MKLGKPSGRGRPGTGRPSRRRAATAVSIRRGNRTHGRSWLVVALILVGLVSFSCRRQAAPPPPPPPEAAPPPPPPPAPTITLSASPATITAGESTTLEWSAQNANMVSIEPGIGMVANNGMRSVSPNSSVTYTATANGPGGTATDTVRVTVNTPPPAPAPPPPPPPEPTIDELFGREVQPIYFDFDQSEIRPDQVGQLQSNARFLQQNQNVQFTISGHADERGTSEYNIGLGDRRANAVRQFLIEQGIAASRIQTISYGEERTVCQQSNEECWQMNRRAEFALR